VHEAAAQRQRAARAESHSIAEETSGDEATMEERDDDKERGDGAGRDENKRERGGVEGGVISDDWINLYGRTS